MNKKTVLITGASGFLGSAIAEKLSKDSEWEVHSVSYSRICPNTVNHQVNLLNHAAITTLIEDVRPSHLIHFAWETRPNIYVDAPTNMDWLSSSLHLLKEFRRLGGVRIVSAGTCNEYDMGHGLLNETGTPASGESLYGVSKRAFFDIASRYCSNAGISYACGRIFFMYGERDKQNRAIPYAITQLLKNEQAVCNAANAYRDYMHVSDGVDGFVLLLKKSDITGAVNIASGVPISMGEIFLEIARQLGREELLVLKERENGADIIVADVKRMRNDLGFTPKLTLADGIKRTLKWQKECLHEGT